MYFKLKSCVNFCPQSLAPDFKAYTCVINNPYLSIGIHSVMQIRIALIPLITYTPPNDLATHNNVYNDRIFDKNIFIFYGKIYYNCSKSFFLQVFLISFLMIWVFLMIILTVYMYVGGLLNNVEQYANIDHNNDVDNHVNLGLATV
jgi:hypothetical protein